jgi:hypothetical protein
MIRSNFFQFIVAFIALLFCSFYDVNAQKFAGKDWVVDSTQKIQYQKNIVAISSGTWHPQREDLAFQISKASFTGKKDKEIAVTVKYGGGCKMHRFQLVRPIQSSKEVLQLYLVHESNNDLCKAFVANDMRFNAKTLKVKKGVKSILINDFKLK